MIGIEATDYDGSHLCRRDGPVLCVERFVHALLRKALGHMENIIVGIIAVLLFGYLFVAMIWPEKF
jgi:K+-transporting ATPase KdpF subunit